MTSLPTKLDQKYILAVETDMTDNSSSTSSLSLLERKLHLETT